MFCSNPVQLDFPNQTFQSVLTFSGLTNETIEVGVANVLERTVLLSRASKYFGFAYFLFLCYSMIIFCLIFPLLQKLLHEKFEI